MPLHTRVHLLLRNLGLENWSNNLLYRSQKASLFNSQLPNETRNGVKSSNFNQAVHWLTSKSSINCSIPISLKPPHNGTSFLAGKKKKKKEKTSLTTNGKIEEELLDHLSTGHMFGSSLHRTPHKAVFRLCWQI